ncbi:flagellar assembly protein FliH [Virgibacillus necropolis]|uniref:flagellar assembly protein FliH n=1 Tax=Virgibacillus necropolis TaxID=163877 RepID=UPI0013747787|nr:flagellar assembly protein FliH [Virgibacillus necropolis]
MSNNYSQDTSTNKQKQIKIRPMELFKKKESIQPTAETIDDELIAKQNKLAELNRDLDHIKHQRETLLKNTLEKIEREKKDWEEEKRQLIKETKELGSKEGFASGKEESLNYYAELVTKTNDIVDSATKDYHAVLESSEDIILRLAIQSAEKIIQYKLEEKPETFVHIVKAAIKDIKEQSTISIYLHPDNYQFVLNQKEELSRLLDSDSKLSIYVKDDTKVNNCFIEHPFGRIDASIDTQLKQLRAILHEVNMENKQ